MAKKTLEVFADLDGIPIVDVNLRYKFRTLKEEPPKPIEAPRQLKGLLTPSDVNLARAQEKRLAQCGINCGGGVTEWTQELLELIQLLVKLTGVMEMEGGECAAVGPRDFISRSLTRKLTRQLQDTLAVVAGALLPEWCCNLTQRLTALFPYAVRYNLFRACAFGPARSLLWLQRNNNSESTQENSERNRRLVNYLQLTEASRSAANISSFLQNADSSLSVADWSSQNVDTATSHFGRCGCSRSTVRCSHLYK